MPDDGLSALMHVDVLNRDLLLAFAAMLVKGFEQGNECPGQFVEIFRRRLQSGCNSRFVANDRWTNYLEFLTRMGGRAVEGTGLENRQTFTRLEGSNPSPSATASLVARFLLTKGGGGQAGA